MQGDVLPACTATDVGDPVKSFSVKRSSTSSYGGLLEKIEILRSTLRWATKFERPEIQKLLQQCNAIRDDVVMQFRKERFIQAAAAGEGGTEQEELEPLSRKPPKRLSATPRRRSQLRFRRCVR